MTTICFVLYTSGSGDVIQRHSGGPFFRWSGTICAIFVEGIMRSNSVKLFRNWTSG